MKKQEAVHLEDKTM